MHTSSKNAFLAAALTLAACTTACALSYAAKPSKPPSGSGPTGVIYYRIDDDATGQYVVRRMNADGSSSVDVYRGYSVWEPSHLPHGGQRWFFDILNVSLDAVAEDGTRVVLVNEPDFEYLNFAHWMRHNDDGWISLEGRRWGTDSETGERIVLDQGIYVAQVAFDATGAITGTVPGTFQLIVSADDFLGEPKDHDWGSDGRLVFAVSDGANASQLWMADFTKPAAQRFTQVNPGSTARIHRPKWSPDGSKIAFNEWGSTGAQVVILTLATGQRKVISGDASHYVGVVGWSPAGDYLLYGRGSTRTGESDFYRATPDGTNRTFLANGAALGWRK